jgi:DNA-directed RNA polymerase specialized sigma24 family protein
MSDVFSAIEGGWQGLAASRDGQATLARWREAEVVLARFADLEQLGAAARGMAGSGPALDHRDEIQRALYRLAKHDSDAQLAALWLVAPALRRAAGGYVGMWTFDEAGAIAVSAALDRIVRFPHDSLRPAACTVRWARRALGREAMFARRDRSEVCRSEVDIEPIDDPGTHAADELLALVGGALRAGYLRPPGARLIVDHRIVGTPTSATAADLGCPTGTVRQRRNRAEAQLATWARQVA